MGVGAVSHVDLPLNDLLSAFVQATGAEVLDSMSKVSVTIGSGSIPVFGEGAKEAEIEKFTRLRGEAYRALCTFMHDVDSRRQRRSGCLPCRGPRQPFIDWRKSMVQVENPRTGRYAWVLNENKDAYLRDNGSTPAAV